jgi:hypothetical protein
MPLAQPAIGVADNSSPNRIRKIRFFTSLIVYWNLLIRRGASTAQLPPGVRKDFL